MTPTKRETVLLNIMGKEYKIVCDAEERQALIDSARQLDMQMRHLRDSGKVNGADRIAVMAALNLVHDFGTSKNQNNQLPGAVVPVLAGMVKKIENVLENH